MKGHTRHTRYRRWIDRAFVGTLGPRRWSALSRHLRDCESCRDYYDELGYVARALSPGSPLPQAAIERIGATVVPRAAETGRRRWRWMGAGVGVAVTAAALLLFLRPGDDGAFRPRGEDLFSDRLPGVRVFCVADRGAHAEVVADAHLLPTSLPASPVECILDGELQLTYSTPDLEGLTMIVFSRDSEGRTLWYAPRSPGAEAVAVHPDAIDEPLAWSTRLEVHHAPGSYEVVARFFDHPVPAGAGADALTRPVFELRGRLVLTEVSP
jgi:hypothetical protein